ncbi:hypothetical protein [Streptomyces hiroshimensis]
MGQETTERGWPTPGCAGRCAWHRLPADASSGHGRGHADPRLRSGGLVTRAPSRNEARFVRIALTADGRRTFAEADATRRETLREAFDDRLDDADIRALETVWAKLKRRPDTPETSA